MSQALDNARALYMEGIRDGNPRAAVEKYTGERYTQHSTGVPDGKEGFIEFFEDFLERTPDREIEILRAWEDGRYLFLSALQILNGGEARWVTADIFDTDSEGRMIEHWDIIQEFATETASGSSMVDGPTEPTDLHLTEQNKQLVARFIADVLGSGKTDRIGEFVHADVIQHNPAMANGLDVLEGALEQMSAAGTPVVYAQIHRVVGCGDMVATLSEATIGEDVAIIDIFRVADGKIAEMWDVMEPIPSPEVAKNSGKF